jgi:hypothetical protein
MILEELTNGFLPDIIHNIVDELLFYKIIFLTISQKRKQNETFTKTLPHFKVPKVNTILKNSMFEINCY